MSEPYIVDLKTCTCTIGRKQWKVLTLFEAAKDLEEFGYPLNLVDKEDDYWGVETLADFIEHARRVESADLSKPIIVSSNGRIMDGYHRICKAAMQGLKSVKAVQFDSDPCQDLTI